MKHSTTDKQEKASLNEPTIVSEDKIDMSKISTISLGEKLAGADFIPSSNTEVDTVKRACAYLIDLVEKYRENHEHAGILTVDKTLLINNAINQILNAQMNVVKVLTFTE